MAFKSMRLALVAGFLSVATASISCGTSTRSLVIGNVTREFEVYRPSSTCQSSGGSADAFMPGIGAPPATTQSPATAVVLCLHGWRQTGSWACMAMCAPHADAHGYIAVCPSGTVDGVNSLTGWNTDEASAWSSVDDVGFFRAAVADVHARANVVQNTTYAIGFSMGGGMIYRLMCEASDLFSGFSVVAQYGPWAPNAGTAAHGASWVGNCTPAAPRPFWASVGTSAIASSTRPTRVSAGRACRARPRLLGRAGGHAEREHDDPSRESRPGHLPPLHQLHRRRAVRVLLLRPALARVPVDGRLQCGRGDDVADDSRRDAGVVGIVDARRHALAAPHAAAFATVALAGAAAATSTSEIAATAHAAAATGAATPFSAAITTRTAIAAPAVCTALAAAIATVAAATATLPAASIATAATIASAASPPPPAPHRHRLRRRRLRRPRHRRPQCRRRRCRPLLHCTAW